MIRVLLVTHSLAGGGAERFVSTLAGALAGRTEPAEFAPEVAVASTLADVYPLPDAVPVHRLGYRGAATLPAAIWRLRRLLRSRRPDVVLSNVLSTNALAGAARVGLRRPPAWVARIGLAPDRGDPALRRRFAAWVYPRADRVVANSRAMAEALRSLHPRVRSVISHPNPVDFERLDRAVDAGGSRPAAADSVATLIAVGRLTPQKRPDLALAALARVRETLPARLVWYGDGALRQAMTERAAALGLADAVDLPGFVDNPFAHVHHADLFWLTSDFEGLPNALIEAQGLGLPAVATRCPYGPEEIVADGETGSLVPVDDAEALAAATLELLADRERREAMAVAARERARRLYGLGPAVDEWAATLYEAASSARR